MNAFTSYQRTSQKRSGNWMNAVVPINMRLPHPSRIPASNGIGYALFRRRKSDCENVIQNARTLASEMELVQRWHLGGAFIDSLATLSSLPTWLATAIMRVSRPGTFVFSNVGDPARRMCTRYTTDGKAIDVGDCRIVDFAAAPPTRCGTEVAILVSLFCQRLTLWIRVGASSEPKKPNLSKSTLDRMASLIRSQVLPDQSGTNTSRP
jgi:hypothetical protein